GVVPDHALVGAAGRTRQALVREAGERLRGAPRGRAARVAQEIKTVRAEWLAQWMPKLTSDEVPLSPYRVIWDLLHTVDVANTIVTHDAGSPRDQLSPFWEATTPLSYIGWGKTTQLGYGLGLAMGAKLARPDKLCVNVWGDAVRDGGARADPDPVRAAEQLLDGHRAAHHESGHREVSLDRHLGELRRHGEGLRRLRRAGERARADRPRHQARDSSDRGGPT